MTAIDITSRPLSEAYHRAQLRRALIASAVGTAIEWYDFQLYSLAAALVFGKLFFPRSDPLVGVMEAFAAYILFCAIVSIVATALLPDYTNRDISGEYA